MAWTLSAGSGTAEVISARTTWCRSSTRCSNASTMASISSMSSFSTTSVSRRRDDLRHRLQREHVAHHALLHAERHAGAGERPVQIGVAGERGAERLQLDEGRIDVARLRDDVEQGARIPARRGAASHGCPSPAWRSDRSSRAWSASVIVWRTRSAARPTARSAACSVKRLAGDTDAHVDVALHLLDEALPLGFGLGLDAALFGGDLLDAARAQGLELARQALQPAIDLGELGGGGGGGLARGLEAAADLLAAAGEVLGERRPQEVDRGRRRGRRN